jgi:O-antigen ligase
MPSAATLLAGVAGLAVGVTVIAVSAPRRKRSAPRMRSGSGLVTLLASLSILLIRLPYLVGYTANEAFATLVPFLVAIAWMLAQPKVPAYRRLAVLVFTFVALLTVALFRGKAAGVGTGGTREVVDQAATVAVAAVFGLLLLSTATSQVVRWSRLAAIALAPAVYVTANLALRFAGFKAPDVSPSEVSYPTGTPAKTLALIGIHTTRQAFPLNSSINGIGVMSAIALVAAAVLAMRSSGYVRRLSIAASLTSLVALLLADTRGALVLSIVTIATMAVVSRPRFALLLAVAVPFSAWILKTVLALPLWADTGAASLLSRHRNDFATGNGRVEIWDAAKHQLGKDDLFHALFGFGANGQTTSGASRHYATLFEQVAKPLLVHVHNLGLQILFDMGIVGLLCLVATVVLGVRRLQEVNDLLPEGPVPALLAGVVMTFITGATEPSPTYRTQEVLFFAILTLAAVAGLPVAPIRRDSTSPPDSADLDREASDGSSTPSAGQPPYVAA